MRIPAAGTIPWRVRDDNLEVALVHRPRYDDWSWAKGKLDDGEEWPVAAVRETEEETGLHVQLGVPLPEARYTLLGRDGEPDEKVVRYWAGRVVGGDGRLVNEIDEVAWLDVQGAYDRLDYSRDREQLLSLVRSHQAGELDTWPLILVRHAKAVSRSDYKGSKDWLRPLEYRGFTRADGLIPVLAAYRITRLVSSPSTRCTQTLAPYAAHLRLTIKTRPGLSEEGYVEDPTLAPEHLRRLFVKGEPVALCSHGPLLPALVDVLSERLSTTADGAEHMVDAMTAARSAKLVKGEALVCHVAGVGDAARIVAVERHLP